MPTQAPGTVSEGHIPHPGGQGAMKNGAARAGDTVIPST